MVECPKIYSAGSSPVYHPKVRSSEVCYGVQYPEIQGNNRLEIPRPYGFCIAHSVAKIQGYSK